MPDATTFLFCSIFYELFSIRGVSGDYRELHLHRLSLVNSLVRDDTVNFNLTFLGSETKLTWLWLLATYFDAVLLTKFVNHYHLLEGCGGFNQVGQFFSTPFIRVVTG